MIINNIHKTILQSSPFIVELIDKNKFALEYSYLLIFHLGLLCTMSQILDHRTVSMQGPAPFDQFTFRNAGSLHDKISTDLHLLNNRYLSKNDDRTKCFNLLNTLPRAIKSVCNTGINLIISSSLSPSHCHNVFVYNVLKND